MARKLALSVVVAMGILGVYAAKIASTTSVDSAIALENAEALSSGEEGSECRWSRVKDDMGCVYHVCVFGGSGDLCRCGSQKG